MKTFFRVFSLIGLVLASLVFGFVFLGEKNIPDRIELVENEELDVGSIYTPKILEKEISVFSVSPKKLQTLSKQSNSYEAHISILNTIPVKSTSVIVNKREYVVPSGEAFGVKIYTDGILVVGMESIATEEGTRNPGKEAGIKIGDLILSVEGKKVTSVSEFNKILKNSLDTVTLSIQRNQQIQSVKLKLAKSQKSKNKKAGLWVRDSTAGVGTLTFYDPKTGAFGGLGHSICDSDTSTVVPLRSGSAVAAKIKGCYKASPGITGELCGVFEPKTLGVLHANLPNGVYGHLKCYNRKATAIPVATKKEVKTGKAKILSTVDEGGPQYYDVVIKKVYPNSDENGKNMIIEITDSALISKTGGIVQGMSGSPILQNGMLVGAVTHVFVNNAREGYGVFAETMIRQAKDFEMYAVKDAA